MITADPTISDDGLILTCLGDAKPVFLKTPATLQVEVREYPFAKIVEVTRRRRAWLPTRDSIDRLADRIICALDSGPGMLGVAVILTIAVLGIQIGVAFLHGGGAR